MATDQEQTPNLGSVTSHPDDYLEAYIKFRTILDGFEIGALRYSLAPGDEDERIKRFEMIEGAIQPLLKLFWKKDENMPMGDCPDGYTYCNGTCVPYNCPGRGA